MNTYTSTSRRHPSIRNLTLTLLLLAASSGSAAANGGDECYNRTLISGTGLFDFSTVGMTTSNIPVPTFCLPNGWVKDDLWYEWVVPASGDYRITTVGHTNVNTVLVVYSGNQACSPPALLACNDNASGCGPCCTQSRVDLCGLVEGQSLTIRLGSCGYQGWGDMQIHAIDCTPGGGSSGDDDLGLIYCQAAPNSLAQVASITGTGSGSIADGSFELSAGPIPPAQYGVFYFGSGQLEVPFGDGFRCVGPGPLGVLGRFPVQQASACGFLQRDIELDALPAGTPDFTPGSTWNFQAWHRDPFIAGGAGFNLSNALSITFQP